MRLAATLLACGACGGRAAPRDEVVVPEPPRPAAPGTQVATGTRGAVTTAEVNATAVGLRTLEAGGNAVDAAVAIGFALAVTHPVAGNLGGGGFMVVRRPDGTATTFDFREVAPAAATRDMFVLPDGAVSDDSVLGPRAAGVPGTVAGLAMAHARLGRLPWATLVAPATALARDGHVLDELHASDLASATLVVDGELARLAAASPVRPGLTAALAASRAIWTRADGSALRVGDTWRQPDLATTLATIEAQGADGFYRGAVAKALASGMASMGGLWTPADLEGYRAIERAPITFEHGGYRVVTMPPPSAGGITLRQILAAAETLDLGAQPWDALPRVHLYVEALRRVFADRSMAIADPAFVDVPVATLTDPTYVAARLRDIDPARATPSAQVGAGVEVSETLQTTHYSVVDDQGLAVAVTYTLNGNFGAHVVVPGTGVLLNNEMDDFTAKVGAANMFGLVQGPQNAIAPGKRMVSSMTPTIVSDASTGALRLVCGSPGGPRIITTVAQIVLQVLDHGRALDEAIAAPRLHHQWLPDRIDVEPGVAPALLDGLRAMGHEIKARDYIGHANCIERVPATGELRAVADVARRGGAAAAR
jgi:gamma-glutamyltranspeptidase/glutathione hydrolase